MKGEGSGVKGLSFAEKCIVSEVLTAMLGTTEISPKSSIPLQTWKNFLDLMKRDGTIQTMCPRKHVMDALYCFKKRLTEYTTISGHGSFLDKFKWTTPNSRCYLAGGACVKLWDSTYSPSSTPPFDLDFFVIAKNRSDLFDHISAIITHLKSVLDRDRDYITNAYVVKHGKSAIYNIYSRLLDYPIQIIGMVIEERCKLDISPVLSAFDFSHLKIAYDGPNMVYKQDAQLAWQSGTTLLNKDNPIVHAYRIATALDNGWNIKFEDTAPFVTNYMGSTYERFRQLPTEEEFIAGAKTWTLKTITHEQLVLDPVVQKNCQRRKYVISLMFYPLKAECNPEDHATMMDIVASSCKKYVFNKAEVFCIQDFGIDQLEADVLHQVNSSLPGSCKFASNVHFS